MPYIPQGCDQQGRHATGAWPSDDIGGSAWRSPHRTHAEQQPDGAHAASDIQGEDRPGVDEMKRRVCVRIFAGITALGVLAITAWLAVRGWN